MQEKEKCRITCGLSNGPGPEDDPRQSPDIGFPKGPGKDPVRGPGKGPRPGGEIGICVCGRGGTACGRAC
jgi:hypothetical protein